MRPSDPRIRANLNRLNEGLESAAQTTQSYLYTASERASPYITPCLASLSTCLEDSCQPCFSARDEHFRSRRHRAVGSSRARGRDGGGIGGFDFYDDWEQEEAEWGNDELERLLSGGEDDGGLEQPRRKVGMSYGSRLAGGGKLVGKRKGVGGEEPNVVPQSSMFGFLESLPWKIGGRGSGRFRPGVADLQEGVGRKGTSGAGAERESGAGDVLLGGEEAGRKNGRGRSGTVESRSTTNSLSSRGDLFPSDDEADAVPLDDEFAMVLERRNTATSDEHSSGMRGGRRPGGSRSSTKTGSSRETKNTRRKGKRESSASSGRAEGLEETAEESQAPTIADLKMEEERVRREEEAMVEERRLAAQKLALERGLASAESEADTQAENQDSKDASVAKAIENEPPPAGEPSDPSGEHHPPPRSPDRSNNVKNGSNLENKPAKEPS